jgi:general secretion pathway protein C
MKTYTKFQQFIISPWLPRSISTLLALVIGWWFVAYTLPLLEPEKPLVQNSTPVVAETIQTEKKSVKDLHLFGKSEDDTSADSALNAEVTKLNLTLRGILATTNDPSQGYAQIENAKKEERNFVVKDSVFGQATLAEIYIDRVILLHNGSYETLLLPEEFLDTKHFLAAQLKQKQKKIVTDYRKLLVNRKGMELIKLFGFDTAYKNGSFIGFIVRALGDEGREMMSTLGVKEGDIIVAVNGESLSESIQAVNNLSKLKDATKVNVEIDREGTRLFFDFDFEEPVPIKEPMAEQSSTS